MGLRDFPFDTEAAKALPALVTIQRGLQTIRFTTWDKPVTINSVECHPAPGAQITNLQTPSDGSPSSCDILVGLENNGPFAAGDGAVGKLDDWPISVAFFDPDHLDDGVYTAIDGSIGSCAETTTGVLLIAANGPIRKQQYTPLIEHYTLTGREDLGDDRCKIPLCVRRSMPIEGFDIGRDQVFVRPDIATGLLFVADAYGRVRTGSGGTVEDYANVYFECTVEGTTDPDSAVSYDPTLGATTVDGDASFVARNAWTRHARGEGTDLFTIILEELPDPRASDPTWYFMGELYIRSGDLADFQPILITDWDPTYLQLTLFTPIPEGAVPAGTQLEITPGCDHTPELCYSRFNNIVNIRAEFLVPPPDVNFSLIGMGPANADANLDARLSALEP